MADEIHSDLILEGKHIPIATLSDEIAQNTLTMIAPSKTYNLAGMACSVLIAQNKEIRETMAAALQSISAHVNIMGYEAAYGAYCGGDEWLRQLLVYLKDNRDFAISYIQQHMPQIKTTVPTSTYLLWMDMRGLSLGADLMDFLTNQAGLAPSPGSFSAARRRLRAPELRLPARHAGHWAWNGCERRLSNLPLTNPSEARRTRPCLVPF